MVKEFKNRLARYLAGSAPSPFGMLSRGPARRKSRVSQQLVTTESCESRAMLSGIAAADAETLMGTTGNDVFTLTYDSMTTSGDVSVTISTNGGAPTDLGTFSMESGIALQGLGGNDSMRVVGTNGNDLFVMTDEGLTVNGSSVSISSLESVVLAGGAGNDTYQLDADGQLGRVTIDDSVGWDTLDFSATTTANVRVNLSLGSVQTVNTNLRLTLAATTTIDNIAGGSGNDILIGNSLNNRVWGYAGNDVLIGMAGNDTLVGGLGNDVYVFGAAASSEADTITEATGRGVDEIRFTNLTTRVVINLGVTTVQTVHTNRTLRLSSATGIENIVGGGGNDILIGNSLANLIVGGAGSDNLRGGAGNDTYGFRTATSAEADTITEFAGGGIDTLSFASITTNVNVNIGITTTQNVHLNRTLTLNSATTIENVVGGHGNDRLMGNRLNNVLRGGAGNDWLLGTAGNDSLVGGAGNDTYVFRTAASAELDTIVELAGEGVDTVVFANITTSVNLSLSTTDIQDVHTNRRIRMSGAGSIENIAGGSGNNTLTGNAGNNILIGGAGNDRLVGGAGNDTYIFRASSTLTTDTIVEAAGGGRDTLDFSAITTSVNVDLSSTTTQTTNANQRLVFSISGTIENVTGGSGNDRLTGNDAANRLIGGAGNDILEGGAGSDRLIGGRGNDTYIFRTATTAEVDTVVETSTGGYDSLNFGSISTNVRVDLSLNTSQTVHVNRSLILQAGANIETVTGGSGNDRLTGNAKANVLRGGAGNDTLIGGAGSDRLIGGVGNDTYVLRNAASAESDSVEEMANGGTDTLYFASVTKNVHVNLDTAATQAIYTNMQLKLNSSLDVENVTGGSGNDTITGNTAANVLIGGAGSDSLLGRTGNDTYVFRSAASAEIDTITELAGAGTDTLNFSAITTALTVNLSSAATQTIHTNRQLKLNLGTSVENVIGGSANDNITGNTLSNVLVGNAGNDRLSGLGGRDILIGGLGLDQLLGGDGEDILIGGRTTVDRLAARLVSLQTAWIENDSYADRIDNLRDGVGSPTVSLKAQVNVLNDSAQKDTLNGGAGVDWYFRALDDAIVGFVAGEEIDLL